MASPPDPSSIEKELRERIENEIREKRRDERATTDDAKAPAPPEPAAVPPVETPEQRRARMESEMRSKLEAEISTRRSRPTEPESTPPPADDAARKQQALDAAKAKAVEAAKAKALADAKAKAVDAARPKGDSDVVFRPPDAAPEDPKRSVDPDARPDADDDRKGGKKKPLLAGPAKKGAKKPLMPAKGKGAAPAEAGKSATGTKVKAGGMSTTKSPAAGNSRRLEADAHIAAEKAKIDQKHKRLVWVLYIGISVITIVAGYAIYKFMPKRSGGSGPAVYDPELYENVPEYVPEGTGEESDSSRRTPPPPRDTRTELDKVLEAANNKAGDQNYDEAVALLKAHRRQTPVDALACNEAIARLVEQYLAAGGSAASWKFSKAKVDELLVNPTPETLRQAIAELREYQANNPDQAFLAEPLLLELANTVYQETRDFPTTGPENAIPSGYERPWQKAGGANLPPDTNQTETPPPTTNPADGEGEGDDTGFKFEL